MTTDSSKTPKVVPLPRRKLERIRKLAELENVPDDELLERALAEYGPDGPSEDQLASMVEALRQALDEAVRVTKSRLPAGKAKVRVLERERDRKED